MGLTLALADDRNAYTLTDRGTYLAYQKRLRLPILLQGDRPLLNIYSVMEVNPANGPKVNTMGGKAFADFMVAPATQEVIKTFGVAKYGQPLFIPIAGTPEDRVGTGRRVEASDRRGGNVFAAAGWCQARLSKLSTSSTGVHGAIVRH
jgi:tungstate transport system substrate-binding protein